MFRDSYQKGFLTVFYSIGSKPLALWQKVVQGGYIKRVVDDDIKSRCLEIIGTNVTALYIAIPKSPTESLAIKLPFLVLLVKNMRKLFTFEVKVLDDQKFTRRIRISNYVTRTRVKTFNMSVPMGLSPGWNQIHLNLADFTRRSYGTNYMETVRLQVHGNIRIRRIYFTDQLYELDDLPNEYRIVPMRAQRRKEKVKIFPGARPPTPAKSLAADKV